MAVISRLGSISEYFNRFFDVSDYDLQIWLSFPHQKDPSSPGVIHSGSIFSSVNDLSSTSSKILICRGLGKLGSLNLSLIH